MIICGIIIAILIGGYICIDYFGQVQVVRNYTHIASNNVTMIIHKENWQNITVVESNSSDLIIIETFYMDKRGIKANGLVMADYVRFVGNKTNLTVYIDLTSRIDQFYTKNLDAHVNISLLKNTNYTIDYVDWDYPFP